MLQAIRDRAQGIFAWVLLLLIGVPFALWGIQNYFRSGKELPLAVVGDRDIFERDVKRAYEEILANLGGLAQFDDKELKRRALERVINEELIRQATEEKGLAVGDEEVRSFIQAVPYFQTDGAFDKEKYKVTLASQNMSPGELADRVRHALTMEQYQKGISDSVLVTPRQVGEFFRLRNQQRQVEYVTVPSRKVEEPIQDEVIAAYYDHHRAAFQDPETVAIDYVLLSLDELAAAVKPSEQDLRTLYEEQKAAFTTKEQRRLSHILVAAEVGNAEAEKAALEKIQAVRDRLQKGEEFSNVAKEVSEDPVSAQKGGDLGVTAPGTMDPSFEKAAMALAKGATSEPVRTPFGYHLIRVTELSPASVKSFDEAQPELVKMFQRNSADSRFYELGQTLTELSFEHPDSLEPAAKAIGRNVERSRPFTREQGEGIAAEEAVRNAAFVDDVLNGKNSDLIELSPERVAVIRVYDHHPAADRPLEQVRSEIVKQIQEERAKEQSRLAAEELKKKLEEGASLSSLAKSAHLTLASPPPFQRDVRNLPAALVNAVFTAPRPKNNQSVAGVAALEDGTHVVYSLKAVLEQSPAKDDKEVESIKALLTNALGQKQFTASVAELRNTKDVHVTPSKE